MRTETKIPRSSKSSIVRAEQESVGIHHEVRLSAREVLCSFTRVLTERERIVLHWLANGLPVREIWQRLRTAPSMGAKTDRPIANNARSFVPPPNTGISQETFDEVHSSVVPHPHHAREDAIRSECQP
jgi:hypothetical protein